MTDYCCDCGCRLWSDWSKFLGICPECKEPDKDSQDLEDELESVLQSNHCKQTG